MWKGQKGEQTPKLLEILFFFIALQSSIWENSKKKKTRVLKYSQSKQKINKWFTGVLPF
jgi:hypothetical protein